MLYKNHTKVDLPKDSFYLSKQEEFESFISGKREVVFQTDDKIVFNKTGIKEPDRTQTVSVKSVVASTDGYTDDTWVYCERSPKVNQKGEYEYDMTPIKVERTITIPTTKKDKIFYMMYLAPSARSKRIKPLNERAVTVAKVEKLAADSRVAFLLTDTKYTVITEQRKRLIAKSFGIQGVDKMTIEEVIIKLLSVIEQADKQGEKERNTNAFLEALNSDSDTDIKANIQDALDTNKIKYDDKQLFYYYAGEDGSFVKKVVSVEPINAASELNKVSTLHRFFIDNPDKVKELRRILGLETTDFDFSKVPYHALKKWVATVANLDAKGTGEELIEKATKYYEEHKDTDPMDMTILMVQKEE